MSEIVSRKHRNNNQARQPSSARGPGVPVPAPTTPPAPAGAVPAVHTGTPSTMPTDYEKAHAVYRDLAKKAAAGDAQAKADKAHAMNEIRCIEREAARAGKVLSATYQGDKVVTSVTECRSKRSMQEEYVHKFDAEKTVNLNGREQTLREYHQRRLLGK